jgi:hypothetical protein
MKNTLKNLIYVADYFDSVQMHEESTALTRIAKKIVISQEDDFDPEEDPIDVDMADDLNTMDDEMIELQKILDELGLSDDQKKEIMDIVESTDEDEEDDVKEFSFEDDMKSEQMMENADMQDEGNQAVFENAVLEGEESDADMSEVDQSANDEIESLLADDPELLKWYRSLGQ